MSEENIQAGKAAQALLNDENFTTGLKAIKDMAHDRWERTQPSQVKEREEFYYLIVAVNLLEGHFKSLAANGQFEEKKLAEKQKKEPTHG